MKRQRTRTWSTGALAAVVLGLGLAAAASASAAHAQTERARGTSAWRASLPHALVGSWTRRITAADNARFGIADAPDGCLLTLSVVRNGKFTLRSSACRVKANAVVWSGAVTQVRAGVVRIDFGVLAGMAPIVAWKVSGRLLLLRALRAPDAGEREMWTGTWRRA